MANFETYGDLKKLINNIKSKQKGEKIISKGKEFALDQVLGLIPGASNAKTAFDFIKTAISKPDDKKTNTWLDKLDVDDDVSKIVDDTVENGFMQAMAQSIESEPDNKKLEDDFNMNQKMVDYLHDTFSGRTVTGIQENNMDKIKKLIKEALSEAPIFPAAKSTNTPSDVKGLDKAQSSSSTIKSKAKAINSVGELPGAFESWFQTLGFQPQTGTENGKTKLNKSQIIQALTKSLNNLGYK